MSEHHYREEMKKHAAEEAIQSCKEAHRLATKVGEIAGRVKHQHKSLMKIQLHCQNNDLYIRQKSLNDPTTHSKVIRRAW